MAGTYADDDARIVRAIVGALREHDLSGFEIWRWLGVVRGAMGALDEAGLYPVLYRLEEEGLILGSWREDPRPRRMYRLTVQGLREAESHGWGAVAYRRADRDRTASPDSTDDWAWIDPASGTQAGESAATESAGAALVDAYLGRLLNSLRLSVFHRNDVRHEISDHIAASAARLRAEGTDPLEASEKALAGLGPPEELAREIDAAQLTSGRLGGGVRWASGIAMFTAMAVLALVFATLELAAPILTPVIVELVGGFGIRLHAADVPYWHAQEVGLAGCVGAFLAARQTMPLLAKRSRRAEPFVWQIWAVTGAVPLAIGAVLIQASLDPLAAAALLAIPAGWVAGTLRPVALDGSLISTRWALLAAAVIVALTWLPGFRVWIYQPATSAGGPPYAEQQVPIEWANRSDPLDWQAGVSLPEGWTDPRLEFRPAVTGGLFIGPDPGAGGPIVVPEQAQLSPADLRGAADWWVTVTAVGPDGSRYTVATEVRSRARIHYRGTILGWLMGGR
jgi:DNA-binding PadR family transcriptional regulator